MARKIFFLLLVCTLAGARARASIVPTALLTHTVSEDTTLRLVSKPGMPSIVKKQGFFTRLKNKLLALALKPSDGSGSTKTTLGWVSIGLFALGFALLTTGAAFASVYLIPAGIATGIIALSMKGDKTNKKERRKSRLLAIIGIVLGVGLVLGLIIAFSGSYWG